jgi:tellurite resistance protein TerC
MIAGVSWVWWLGFHAVVAAWLVADSLLRGTPSGSPAPIDLPMPASPSGLPGRQREPRRTMGAAWLATVALVLAAAGLAAWIAVVQGHQPALEFVGGYAIEVSLSIDNLFVFMAIFQGFRLNQQRQRDALLWGVGGAVVLRGLFIAAGIALLTRFHWITWVLGLILLYAAWRLVRGRSPKWIRNLRPAGGSLLPVIIAVELTDVLFAMDSIPAVLAISHNPFVVYTSNITAVLGLRSLYFALSSLLDRLRYLHYGLAAILAFVALKMIAARWIEVPITMSLAAMGAILAACAVASWIAGARDQRSEKRDQ